MIAVRTTHKLQPYIGLLTTCHKQRISTTGQKQSEKIYEFRKYQINPKDVKPFMALSSEWMHVRTGHSKLIGYWVSEVGGGINDMVHIWEYDSLSHRAKVRQALAGDPVWVDKYFSKILPWIQKQENALYKCIPGTTVKDPPGKGVYEMQMIVGSHGPESLRESLNKIQRPLATLLGSFYNILGVKSLDLLLWHHPSLENVTETSTKFDKDTGLAVVVSSLLLPTPWSTMK